MNRALPTVEGRFHDAKPYGFSLLEVLLAMGILFGSLAVLSHLAALGIQHLNRAETSVTAVRLCQNKLGEVLAGIEPLENIEDQPILEDPQWNYSIQVQTLDPLPLSEVRVRVARVSEVQRNPNGRRGRYELVRWIHQEGKGGLDSPPQSSTEVAQYHRSSSHRLNQAKPINLQ